MPNRSPDEIRNDIEHTREGLGDTVEALAAKTDVKAQAHAKIDDVKQQAKSKLDDAKQRVEAAVGHGSDGDSPAAATAAHAGQSTQSDVADKARAGAQRVQQTAVANPVAVAALGGFVGGLIVGRLMCRRH